jgi:hypothetical protein
LYPSCNTRASSLAFASNGCFLLHLVDCPHKAMTADSRDILASLPQRDTQSTGGLKNHCEQATQMTTHCKHEEPRNDMEDSVVEGRRTTTHNGSFLQTDVVMRSSFVTLLVRWDELRRRSATTLISGNGIIEIPDEAISKRCWGHLLCPTRLLCARPGLHCLVQHN